MYSDMFETLKFSRPSRNHDKREHTLILEDLRLGDEYSRRRVSSELSLKILDGIVRGEDLTVPRILALASFAYAPTTKREEYAISRYDADEFFAENITSFPLPLQELVFDKVKEGLAAIWEDRAEKSDLSQTPVVQDAVELALRSGTLPGFKAISFIAERDRLPHHNYHMAANILEQKGETLLPQGKSLREDLEIFALKTLSKFRLSTLINGTEDQRAGSVDTDDQRFAFALEASPRQMAEYRFKAAVHAGEVERGRLIFGLKTFVRKNLSINTPQSSTPHADPTRLGSLASQPA